MGDFFKPCPSRYTLWDLCINRNNHQKPAFHPLGDFLNPALALLGQGLKKSPIGQKLDFANHPLMIKFQLAVVLLTTSVALAWLTRSEATIEFLPKLVILFNGQIKHRIPHANSKCHVHCTKDNLQQPLLRKVWHTNVYCCIAKYKLSSVYHAYLLQWSTKTYGSRSGTIPVRSVTS
jgi:hypothetical protein